MSLWSPRCAFPGCTNRVGYHKRTKKVNGKGYSFKWKAACERHRTVKQQSFDKWKMEKGCENKDERYGFSCSTTISSPEQLDVHHIDGNRKNNDPKNLEILCRCCHARVTVENGDHLNRYENVVYLNPDLFEEE